MPAFTPLVLTDAETTPVVHTFDISRLSNGRLRAVNRAAPTPETQEVLVIEVKNGNASAGTNIRITLGCPATVTNADTGVVSVDYVNSIVMEVNTSNKSTLMSRKNLLALAISLLEDAMVQEVIHDGEPVYG